MKLYDSEQEEILLSDNNVALTPVRTTHDGLRGTSSEFLLFVRNDDDTKYITNLTVQPGKDLGEGFENLSGGQWTIKVISGAVQPTESEWSAVANGESVALPNIGALGEADTTTYVPFWVRVHCRGNTPAQLYTNNLVRISFVVKNA